MTITEMWNEAMTQVLDNAEADCIPIITVEEIDRILTQYKRASIWTAETDYTVGDVVQLSTRNDHRYRCVVGGESDTTAPDWPKGAGSTVGDGDDIVWQEEGPDYANVYDVRAALAAIWNLKALRSSNLVDSNIGGNSVSASQIQAQCRARAREFAPLFVA